MVFMTAAKADEDSRCPTLLLIDPTIKGSSLFVSALLNTSLIAENSNRSPAAVPVP